MSFYNMLFGVNPNTDLVLALIELKRFDIERFRDCGVDFDDEQIWVYTRTGGRNREDFPNDKIVSNPHYIYDEDDDFDPTYATYYFRFPDEIREDIHALQDIEKNGISAALIRHVMKTFRREKTSEEIREDIREEHREIVRDLRMTGDAAEFNGHTVVPLSDSGMFSILRAAEENDGEFLGAYFGALPLEVVVTTDIECALRGYRKIDVKTTWKIDTDRWERWKAMYSEKFPKAVAKIQEEIDGRA